MNHTTSLPRTSVIATYVQGYFLSIVITFASFVVVALTSGASATISQSVAIACVSLCAVVQIILQVFYFLHLGDEEEPRWMTVALVYTTLLVLCVVIGSLWIMNNLQYNMMSPQETDRYMLDQ